MTTTIAVQRAVMKSELPPNARLIMHTLAARADFQSAEIPEEHTPSLTDLRHETGLARSSVAKFLNLLEESGWVERSRPTHAQARLEYARTGYRLLIGDPCPPADALPKKTTKPSPQDGLGPRPVGDPGPRDGLVRDTDQGASPQDGLALVRDTVRPSPSGGRVVRKTPTGSPPSLSTPTNQDPSKRASAPQPAAPAKEPTANQRAFGIARGWIDRRAQQGTPVVTRGKADPLHALRRLIEPFVAAYTDTEIKYALDAIGESIPSTAQLDRELVRIRSGRGRTSAARPSASTVRHIDQLTPEERDARNPFKTAVRSSQVTGEAQ